MIGCRYESSNRDVTNRLIKASYRKGWYDGVVRALKQENWKNSKDVDEAFIIDSLKFTELMEW